jgi:aminocarboxymuconate-semialdehyde decarboxylase
MLIAADVLDFWFGGDPTKHRKVWFERDPDFDVACARFAQAREAAKTGALDHWAETPEDGLALLILLDQISRNLFRGQAEAFAADAKALELARDMIARGLDRALTPVERTFVYLPFEHSENPADQADSVRLFTTLEADGGSDALDYALHHHDVIRRFGRFPQRNRALGRMNTEEEEAYLADPDTDFGTSPKQRKEEIMGQPSNRYGLTAARRRDRPGRELRPSSTTIDMHAHMAVDAAAGFAGPHVPPDPRARYYTEETRILTRSQDADRHGHLTQLQFRLDTMDEMGIDLQVVSPAPPQSYYTVPPDIGVKTARLVNDGIAEAVAQRPDRLRAMGTVPMQAGGVAAAEELQRCVQRLGFKGVQILTHVGDKEISDPDFAPFWAEAEALGAVVMIHPAGFTEAQRLGRYYFNNVIGNPFDTTLALHYLIFDGVLERHPALKLIAVHGGGYLPAYSGRIDHAWGARSDAHGSLPHAPSMYLKKIYIDTIVFTPHQLEALVKLFGPGKILLGTDYPYDMGEYDPIGHLASVDGMGTEMMAAIAGGNAKQLFGV